MRVFGAGPVKLESYRGPDPQSSPEQICLEVGEIGLVQLFAWAMAHCAEVFCWDGLCGWPGRPEIDEPGRFLEGRRNDVDLYSER
jgi:hypothetical protein